MMLCGVGCGGLGVATKKRLLFCVFRMQMGQGGRGVLSFYAVVVEGACIWSQAYACGFMWKGCLCGLV